MKIGTQKQIEAGTAREATTEELRAYFPWASDDFFQANEQAPVTPVAEQPAQGDGQGARPRQNQGKRSRGAKFHNEPTFYNGRRYDSKKEARHAEYLDLLKSQGIILSWVPQVPFPLPGGAVHRVDFMVLTPGAVPTVGFQEIKGRDLAMGKLKRKQVEEIYHIKIEVV